VYVCGLATPDRLVLQLAVELRNAYHSHTAERLEVAVATGRDTVNLDIGDREAILYVLRDPLPGLETLRTVLLNERSWRDREGIC
jgi:hypothetical protein